VPDGERAVSRSRPASATIGCAQGAARSAWHNGTQCERRFQRCGAKASGNFDRQRGTTVQPGHPPAASAVRTNR
jgi:hypothetical protein